MGTSIAGPGIGRPSQCPGMAVSTGGSWMGMSMDGPGMGITG